jgi:hypothetical protein
MGCPQRKRTICFPVYIHSYSDFKLKIGRPFDPPDAAQLLFFPAIRSQELSALKTDRKAELAITHLNPDT